MPAYRPGQGLNTEALQRLKARVHTRDAAPALPSQDESNQWDRLLGEGAKKKVRCGICTKPLDDEVLTKGGVLCLRCTPKNDNKGMPEHCRAQDCSESMPEQQSSKTRSVEDSCPTPSTEAASELEGEIEGVHSPQETSVRSPPALEQILLEVARKGLEGDWVDEIGVYYTIKFEGELQWTCTYESSSYTTSYHLTYDLSKNVIWWGNAGKYFLDMSEISQELDQIVWQCDDDSRKHRPRFVLYRPCEAEEETTDYQTLKENAISLIEEQLQSKWSDGRVSIPNWKETYYNALGSLRQFLESCPEKFSVTPGYGKSYTVALNENDDQRWPTWAASWQDHKWSLADHAIYEIERQLSVPGSNGFVWVDDWKETYQNSLGSLRNFLESQPNKFKVIPGKGKGYRVAFAKDVQ
mmetsp:Transcript_82068/g.145465  ORF Transcript_82068/g.145465 Transcript_82068/m.145465 type:complete len:410 (-) Transcript_82068:139-1368(-)